MTGPDTAPPRPGGGRTLAAFSRDPLAVAFLRCFLRSYMVGAGFNSRGLQNIGFSYAMEPGLRAIHAQDPEALKRARRRYVGIYNSHPFWAACLVGICLSMERLVAGDRMPPAMLKKVRTTTTYTLSAIGDSVFAGSVLIFWALASANLLAAGHDLWALVFGAALFAALQLFRGLTFYMGLKMGFRVLERLKHIGLIDWGRRIKFANALLVLLLWWQLWPVRTWWGWGLGAGGLLLAGALNRRLNVPRELLAAVVLAALVLLARMSG